MLETIGVADRLDGVTCAIRAIRVSEGLKPGGIAFEPGEDDDPLGIMVENRLLRAALRDTALAAERLDLLMPARPAEVVRDGNGVRVALADGRLLDRARAGRRRGPQLADARGRRDRRRPVALRPCRDRRHHRPRKVARGDRLRDLLPRRAVRDPADAGGRGRAAALGDRLVGQGARRRGDARPARPRARARDREKDGRLPGRGRLGRAALELSARLPPCGDDHRRAPRPDRRRRPRHPPDRRPGPQSRLPRRRRSGRGAGRRRAARPGPRRRAAPRPLRALAQPRHLHGGDGDRQPDPALRRARPRRLGAAPPRHGRGAADRAAQGPADGRGARRERASCRCCCAACRSRPSRSPRVRPRRSAGSAGP